MEDAKTDVTTTFVGSMVVEKNDPASSTYGAPQFIKSMTTEYMMTLKKALCRPIQVASGNWSTTDIIGTNVFSNYVPEVLLSLPIVNRKVDGFQGIRGSITLRLQATGTPQQQGLLKLMFYPMYDQDTSVAQRELSLLSWSFFPNVELNLGKETACELRIPFTLPVSFCDLMTATAALRPQMGAVFVRVYSPLKVGTGVGTTVGWNLYAHWNEDDLELFNPTPNVYQSGGSRSLVKHSTLPQEKEKKGTSISDSLAMGATLATAASAIPVLADIAGPTSWALRVASKVASAFGFARPALDEKPRMVVPYAFPYNSNVEGPDCSLPLSLTIQPSLKIEPKLGGKTEDEMTIDYFVTKFGWHQNVNIVTGNTAGTVILNVPLGPIASVLGAENLYPKPCQILAQLFQFWRGNMRIRLKFVKTKLHAMRLMFVFLPGTIANATLASCEYAHREIIDISSIEEKVFELPFTSQYPYLGAVSGLAGAYGSFQVLVVNPLQAPATVANNIDMIVETAMGEGSEWFCPSLCTDILPTIVDPSARPKEPRTFDLIRSGVNQPQAGQSSGLVKVSTLSDAQITGHQTETAQLCVGEKLLSLRQLIKYPSSLVTSFIQTVVVADASGGISTQYYQPFSFGATSTLGTSSVRTRDFLGVLGPYFRFSRGGMRVRGNFGTIPVGAVQSNTNSSVMAFAAGTAVNAGMAGADPGTFLPWGSEQVPITEGIWKFLLPAWQTVPMVDHHYVQAGTPADTTLIGRQAALYLRGMLFPASQPIKISFSRQPADDYELIGFVGPPLFTLGTS
jgi:hypothetical protein